METLMQLMELFQDDESIEKLIVSKDYDEILEIIKKYWLKKIKINYKQN